MSHYKQESSEKSPFIPRSERLMDQVREVLRYHHYAIRTEGTYVKWILAFIRFNQKRHPKEMGRIYWTAIYIKSSYPQTKHSNLFYLQQRYVGLKNRAVFWKRVCYFDN